MGSDNSPKLLKRQSKVSSKGSSPSRHSRSLSPQLLPINKRAEQLSRKQKISVHLHGGEATKRKSRDLSKSIVRVSEKSSPKKSNKEVASTLPSTQVISRLESNEEIEDSQLRSSSFEKNNTVADSSNNSPKTPGKKVAFSDGIEESVVVSSPTKGAKDVRPILKQKNPSEPSNDHDIALGLNDPFSEVFWSPGSVKQLSARDPNILPLIDICVRALSKEDFSRKFEVYATLDLLVRTRTVAQRIVAHAPELFRYIRRDIELCEEVLLNQDSPDPFLIRLDSQAIRLGSFLMEDSAVMFVLSKQGVMDFLTRSARALKHEKIPKNIATMYLQMFREQRVTSSSWAPLVEILLDSVLSMRSFPSNNIVVEKLNTLKSLLVKCRRGMAKNIVSWFSFVCYAIVEVGNSQNMRVVTAALDVVSTASRLLSRSADTKTDVTLFLNGTGKAVSEPSLTSTWVSTDQTPLSALSNKLIQLISENASKTALNIWACINMLTERSRCDASIPQEWVNVWLLSMKEQPLVDRLYTIFAWKTFVYALFSSREITEKHLQYLVAPLQVVDSLNHITELVEFYKLVVFSACMFFHRFSDESRPLVWIDHLRMGVQQFFIPLVVKLCLVWPVDSHNPINWFSCIKALFASRSASSFSPAQFLKSKELSDFVLPRVHPRVLFKLYDLFHHLLLSLFRLKVFSGEEKVHLVLCFFTAMQTPLNNNSSFSSLSTSELGLAPLMSAVFQSCELPSSQQLQQMMSLFNDKFGAMVIFVQNEEGVSLFQLILSTMVERNSAQEDLETFCHTAGSYAGVSWGAYFLSDVSFHKKVSNMFFHYADIFVKSKMSSESVRASYIVLFSWISSQPMLEALRPLMMNLLGSLTEESLKSFREDFKVVKLDALHFRELMMLLVGFSKESEKPEVMSLIDSICMGRILMDQKMEETAYLYCDFIAAGVADLTGRLEELIMTKVPGNYDFLKFFAIVRAQGHDDRLGRFSNGSHELKRVLKGFVRGDYDDTLPIDAETAETQAVETQVIPEVTASDLAEIDVPETGREVLDQGPQEASNGDVSSGAEKIKKTNSQVVSEKTSNASAPVETEETREDEVLNKAPVAAETAAETVSQNKAPTVDQTENVEIPPETLPDHFVDASDDPASMKAVPAYQPFITTALGVESGPSSSSESTPQPETASTTAALEAGSNKSYEDAAERLLAEVEVQFLREKQESLLKSQRLSSAETDDDTTSQRGGGTKRSRHSSPTKKRVCLTTDKSVGTEPIVKAATSTQWAETEPTEPVSQWMETEPAEPVSQWMETEPVEAVSQWMETESVEAVSQWVETDPVVKPTLFTTWVETQPQLKPIRVSTGTETEPVERPQMASVSTETEPNLEPAAIGKCEQLSDLLRDISDRELEAYSASEKNELEVRLLKMMLRLKTMS